MALNVACGPCLSNPNDPRQGNVVLKRLLAGGNPEQVLLTYVSLQHESGFRGDNYTYPVLLKAASALPSRIAGYTLHGQSLKTGFVGHTFVQTALLMMYSALGEVGCAEKVFNAMLTKDLVAWNSMLGAYAQGGRVEVAGELLESMPVRDQVSYNTVLAAYASAGEVERAVKVFEAAPSRDILSWNSLMFAYVKAGRIGEALEVFDRMPDRSVVSWNTILSALVQARRYNIAMGLFHQMISDGVEPNHVTFSVALSACAHSGSLYAGTIVHIRATTAAPELARHPQVATALIDMYAKCGSIERALEVFYKAPGKWTNVYCWNAMISGLAIHGHGRAALKLFQDMQGTTELRPDEVTFIAVLSACTHAGLVDEGLCIFRALESRVYGVPPRPEHYAKAIDLVGRAGRLAEALDLVKTIPVGQLDAAAWGALLSACMILEDKEKGGEVLRLLVESGCNKGLTMSDGVYMILVNMYARLGRWEESQRWRAAMNGDDKVVKTAGWSAIEVGGRMYKFLAGPADGAD